MRIIIVELRNRSQTIFNQAALLLVAERMGNYNTLIIAHNAGALKRINTDFHLNVVIYNRS